jgi:hypothetical protein
MLASAILGCGRGSESVDPQGMPCASASPAQTYRYTESEGFELLGGEGRYQVLEPFHREIWLGTDGSGRLSTQNDQLRFFGSRDAVDWAGYVSPSAGDRYYGPGKMAVVDLAPAPTDPSDLRTFLLKGHARPEGSDGPSATEVVLRESRDYLHETVAPASLRHAIAEMLRAEPGLTVVDDTGGTVFSTTTERDPRVRFDVALDADGRLMWEKRSLLDRVDSIDAEPPVVVSSITYLTERIVATCVDVDSP